MPFFGISSPLQGEIFAVRLNSIAEGVAVNIFGITVWEMLILIQHELLLFAAVFFLIGAIDDIVVDVAWLWLKISGKAKSDKIDSSRLATAPLNADAAVFIPTWQESQVISDTIAHALAAWPQDNLRIYVGCYRNDPDTIEAVMQAAPGDARLRLVVHDKAGPTTKADCLNRLYTALRSDEMRGGFFPRMVLFHDAEDMVDPAALKLLDDAIEDSEFVQLPVLPLPQARSRWIGSHYCEEFAEAHGKSMVVRDALGAALPAAGVGCAVSREALQMLAERHEEDKPFADDSLTEDYELGLAVAESGGRCSFVRKRHRDGQLIATRAYFPSRLVDVVRQKTRWVHGIAFQGWDRLGWVAEGASPSFIEMWMRMRDRRGPLAALVLFVAYVLLGLSAAVWLAAEFGYGQTMSLTPTLALLLAANFAAFVWRATMRFAFTAREYGVIEGFRAVLRIPVANIIAIMAGRRALMAYARTLRGSGVVWDKTPHTRHPMHDRRWSKAVLQGARA